MANKFYTSLKKAQDEVSEVQPLYRAEVEYALGHSGWHEYEEKDAQGNLRRKPLVKVDGLAHIGRTDGIIKASYLDTEQDYAHATYIDFYTLLECKLNQSFREDRVRAEVLLQVVCYLKQMQDNGDVLPKAVIIGSKVDCFAVGINALSKYAAMDITGYKSASTAYKYNTAIMQEMLKDEVLLEQCLIFDINADFDMQNIAERVVKLAKGINLRLSLDVRSVAKAFDYFTMYVLKNTSKMDIRKQQELFLKLLLDAKDNDYVLNNDRIYVAGERVDVDGRAFRTFQATYKVTEPYTSDEERAITATADRLIEDADRRRKGDFYTPTVWVDEAHKMLTEQLGADWREKYVVWDCACYSMDTEIFIRRAGEEKWVFFDDFNQEMDEVLTLNPETLEKSWGKVSSKIDKMVNALDMIEIETSASLHRLEDAVTGRIKVTSDHKVLVYLTWEEIVEPYVVPVEQTCYKVMTAIELCELYAAEKAKGAKEYPRIVNFEVPYIKNRGTKFERIAFAPITKINRVVLCSYAKDIRKKMSGDTERVWCLTTESEHHNFYVRRGDLEFFCGNCGTKNLTRDYGFKELYSSTLIEGDLALSSKYNVSGTPRNELGCAFQYDFLNDDVDEFEALAEIKKIKGTITLDDIKAANLKLYAKAPGLLESLCAGKKLLFFINPPYGAATDRDVISHAVTSRSNMSATRISKLMNANKIGHCVRNLYAQFIYRCMLICDVLGVEFNMGLFSPTSLKAAPSFSGLRAEMLKRGLKNYASFTLCASQFAGCADNWGILFSCWSANPSKIDIMDVDVYRLIDGNVVLLNTKKLWNLDNATSCSDWAKPLGSLESLDEYPQLSSALVVKVGKAKITPIKGSIGYMVNVANSVEKNNSDVFWLSACGSFVRGTPALDENFLRMTAYFTARRLITGPYATWVNWQDEYMIPNTEHPDYARFEADSIVYSLFNAKSNQSSLRDIDYNGKKWNIKNEFFWLSSDTMLALARAASPMNKDVEQDVNLFTGERYVYTLLQQAEVQANLSDTAKAVLAAATKLVIDSFKYRQDFAFIHPEYHINTWDAGWYQIKGILKEYMPDELKQFSELYKQFGDELRPLVYELGFLYK